MHRRQFLKSSGFAVGTFSSVHAFGNRSILKIRAGQIGTKHAHASGQMGTMRQLSNDYDVIGVVEPDDQRWNQVKDSSAYRDVPRMTEEQLLNAKGLQVVAVETEIRDLLATAQKCVDAGMHIHLDKPAGESYPRLLKLHETAQQKSLSIQMGYMFRYNPAFTFLFRAVKDGWLGEVFELHGVMSKMVGNSTRKELGQYRGGSMLELGCHLIDPLLYIMHQPKQVRGVMLRTRPETDNLYDNTLAVFEFEKASATIRSAVVEVDGGRRRQFVVCGDEGTIEILPLEPPKLQLTLSKPIGNFKKGRQIVELAPSKGRYHGAWSDFAKVMRNEKKHDFSHEHDLAVQKSLLIACGYDLQ